MAVKEKRFRSIVREFFRVCHSRFRYIIRWSLCIYIYTRRARSYTALLFYNQTRFAPVFVRLTFAPFRANRPRFDGPRRQIYAYNFVRENENGVRVSRRPTIIVRNFRTANRRERSNNRLKRLRPLATFRVIFSLRRK